MDKEFFKNKKDCYGHSAFTIKKYYVHFDSKISMAECWDYISDPNKVAHHNFFPFIKYEKIFKKCVPHINTDTNKVEKGIRDIKFKKREICYASHIDGCIYEYYAAELNDAYNRALREANIDYDLNDKTYSSVIAYRTNMNGKSNIHYAHEAFEFIRSKKECMVIVGDFKSFFDRLNHSYLKQQLKIILNMKNLSDDWYSVFKSITKYSYVDLGQLIFRTCRGNTECFKQQYVSNKNIKEDDACASENKFCCRYNYCKANNVQNSYGGIQKYASSTKQEADKYNQGKCLNRYCQKIFNGREKIDIKFVRDNKLIKIPHRYNDNGKYEAMGIPQGSAISAVLANVYMYEFDSKITKYVRALGGLYMRYSDDFIIVLPKDDNFNIHLKYLKDEVKKVHVILEDKKTQVFSVDLDAPKQLESCSSKYFEGIQDGKDAIDYLGFTFDGKDVTIKSKTIFKYYYRMYSKIKYIKRSWKLKGKYSAGTANLYKRYSSLNFHWVNHNPNEKHNYTVGNFLTYVKRVKYVFTNDPNIDLPIRHHVQKIVSRLNRE